MESTNSIKEQKRKKKVISWLISASQTNITKKPKSSGMFGNCVFLLFFCFQKQFSIFGTKKLIWQPKMNRKQKLFPKLNL